MEPLISPHLTRVELYEVELRSGTSPSLEDLELSSCSIEDARILLPSVKRLTIICCRFNLIPRISISAPSLVSLQLSGHSGLTPLLATMPSLVTAFVRFDNQCEEQCFKSYFGDCGDGTCYGCYGSLFDDDVEDQCVLLDGLSGATNLELIALPEVYVCRKDFKWCRTFSKLKTLLLNEWCVAADFSALVYFLQHSPILERLTLQLYKESEPVLEANGCYNPREGSLVSKHLKVVEVKYHEDVVLEKLLMILNTCGVPPEKVAIRKTNSRSSEKFGFEQKDED